MEDSDPERTGTEDEDEDDKERYKEADKMTVPKEVNTVMSSFEPHIIHHFDGLVSEKWSYEQFRYYLE